MHLVPQRVHRYLGEDFSLVFTIAVDEGVTPSDVGANRKFTITHRFGTVDFDEVIVSQTEPTALVVSVEVLSSSLSEVWPGSYPFQLALEIAGQDLVVSKGVIHLDRASALGGAS